jgi:hypothetical protein
MLKLKMIHVLALIAFVGMFSSCKKYFGDVNKNPNDPAVVTPDVLLPIIQTNLAYTYWGDGSRFASIYTQHIDGVTRQFSVIQNYGIQGSDVDNMWSNLYSGVLADIKKLKEISVDKGYNHYEGAALVLEAYTLMFVTDMWGDIPYSNGFAGTDNLAPQFDSQESVYNTVFTLLDQAEAKLNVAAEGRAPAADDLFYGGDEAQWIKLINGLRARASLHLAKRNNSYYNDVLTALNNGLASSADDARLPFEATASGSAPWFQYIEQRADIAEGSNYVARLNALNDPRVDFFGHDLTDVAHPYFTADQAVPMLSYTEALFMKAEALFNTEGATANTHDAYLDAIAASFDELDLNSDYAAYVAQNDVDPGQANLTLEHIMTQKYLSLYADPEVFNDWRRTGIPSLTPNSGSEVPRRLPYSENEVTFNSSASAYLTTTIFQRIWWDVN